MSPRKGSGRGLYIDRTNDGYLRICRRGPLRDQFAHRAYVNRQMQLTYGRDLSPNEEVHHLCRNRLCWPPTDFHLVILDAALHHATDAGREPWRRRYARGIAEGEYERVNTSELADQVESEREAGDESDDDAKINEIGT